MSSKSITIITSDDKVAHRNHDFQDSGGVVHGSCTIYTIVMLCTSLIYVRPGLGWGAVKSFAGPCAVDGHRKIDTELNQDYTVYNAIPPTLSCLKLMNQQWWISSSGLPHIIHALGTSLCFRISEGILWTPNVRSWPSNPLSWIHNCISVATVIRH